MTDPLRADLNEFLFASIADESNGMHLTMLSALARTGVDPWETAGRLHALSREDAAEKLVHMLAAVPNGPSPGDDTTAMAERLVGQLHSPSLTLSRPKSPARAMPGNAEESPLRSFSALPRRVRLTIYSLVAAILMIMGYRALSGGEAQSSDGVGQQQSR